MQPCIKNFVPYGKKPVGKQRRISLPKKKQCNLVFRGFCWTLEIFSFSGLSNNHSSQDTTAAALKEKKAVFSNNWRSRLKTP